MAERPLFVPDAAGPPWIRTVDLEFQWHPGFSRAQAQRSIASLHSAAAAAGYAGVLEISSKSEEPLGRQLSAFHLQLTLPDGSQVSVENAFQGSKVFTTGGPYTDLYRVSARDAKKDVRVRGEAPLQTFSYFGVDWPLEPTTLFYDWLYLNALRGSPHLAEQLCSYGGFTDIAFNPQRSLNCQARSAALYVALQGSVDLDQVLASKRKFLIAVSGESGQHVGDGSGEQMTLW